MTLGVPSDCIAQSSAALNHLRLREREVESER